MGRKKLTKIKKDDIDLDTYAFGYYSKLPVYNKFEIKKLFEEYSKNRTIDLKNKLIIALMRVVVDCAKAIYRDNKTIEFDDLVNTGFMKLGDIIDQYDPNGKVYITTLIYRDLNRINKTIDNPFNITYSQDKVVNKLKKAITEYEEIHYKKPSINDLALITGIHPLRIQELMILLKKTNDLEDDNIMIDDTANEVFNSLKKEELLKVLTSALTYRQREVIFLRYGINNTKKHTQEEASKIMNVTPQRINEIEAQALRNIRKYIARNNLSYYDFNREEESINSITKPVNSEEEYNDYIRDYEGYTPEEYENMGIGFR